MALSPFFLPPPPGETIMGRKACSPPAIGERPLFPRALLLPPNNLNSREQKFTECLLWAGQGQLRTLLDLIHRIIRQSEYHCPQSTNEDT